MRDVSLSVERLFDGKAMLQAQVIEIENGIISAIRNHQSDDQEMLRGTLSAGFIDTQVNGGGGYLFNQSPTPKTLSIIAKAHQKYGTTGWLPTLISDSLEHMQQAADAVAAAILDKNNGILGIHFEGPHLSVTKRGIHPESMIRSLSKAEEEIFLRQDIGKVVLTVAPESVDTAKIKTLVDAGVIVSIGHSNASFEQTQQAIAAGASGFTHLFNAMSQFNSREPGVVGAALLNQKCFSGIILDGHHVHPASARVAYDSNTQLMLVTDAMATVATELSQFEYFGEQITFHHDPLRGCSLRDHNNRLAGSTLDICSAVNNAQKMLSITAIDAIKLATINPAKFLGVDDQYGILDVGKKADMVLLDQNTQVISSWIEGEQIS